MLKEVLVIALRVIAARVRTAALLAGNGALDDGLRDLQEVAELDVLLVGRVVDVRRIADVAILVLVLKDRELLDSRLEVRAIAEDASLEPHRLDHVVANLRHRTVAVVRARSDLLEGIEPLLAIFRQLILTALVLVRLGVGRRAVTGRMAEDEDLREGVRTEAVGAVDRDAAALAGRVDTRHARLARMEVRHLEAAHRVVAGRTDEDGFLRDVDAGEAQ